MNFPNEIHIGPRTYSVNFEPDLMDIHKERRLNGQILFDSETSIKIDDNLCDQAKRLTLFHEIVHGMEQAVVMEFEERLVELLAYQIIELFERNPDLLELFQVEPLRQ